MGQGHRPIIDSHTHILPHALATKIRAFFDAYIMAAPADAPLPPLLYPATPPAEIVPRIRKDGVDCIWTLPYAHKKDMAGKLNRDMISIGKEIRSIGIDVVVGCTVHPDDNVKSTILDAIKNGSRVVKLHCSVGDYLASDPRLKPLWLLSGSLCLPVVVHVGHSIQGTTESPELSDIDTVARNHPDALIIIAHTAHPATLECLNLALRHENIYVDTTPVVTSLVTYAQENPDTETLRLAKELASRQRILFGSDVPNVSCSQRDQINALYNAFKEDGEILTMGQGRNGLREGSSLDGILGGTAMRLLRNFRMDALDSADKAKM